LFLDVDAAPFLAFEMLSLRRAGMDVTVAGSREIPRALLSGEFADLAAYEVVLPWFGREALAAGLHYAATRPLRTLGALTAAIAAYVTEPAHLAKLLGTLGWTLAAARWAERHGIEHLHANWAHLPASSAWIASRLTGLPFSFSGHAGRDLFRTTALLGRKVREARFVVVCNRAAGDQLAAHGGRESAVKIRVCHHGVDLERFRPRPAPTGELVLSVGNLDPAKGFDLMLHATALLRRQRPGLRYRIVGEGPERGRLEALIGALGVAEAVTLAGALRGDALVEAYRQASVFVVPSRLLSNGGRDGLPNVLLEAMASGVPAVGSSVAAIPEAIEHERTGLLVPPEDPRALAAAIGRLLDDRTLAERLTRAARERVLTDFDRRRNVARYCSLFSSSEKSPG